MNTEYQMISDRVAQITALLGTDAEKLPRGVQTFSQEDFQSPNFVDPEVTEPPVPPLHDISLITIKGSDGQVVHVLTKVDPAARMETGAIVVADPKPLREHLGTLIFMQHSTGNLILNRCINNAT